MTLFIKLENGLPTGDPIVETNFRQLFSSTSFPKYFTADVVEPLGYGIYDYSNRPNLELYKKAEEVAPVRSDAGIWKQTWQVADMTDAEKQNADVKTSEQNRAKRNALLAETDYFALTDVTMDAAMTTYRQSLRDITSHKDWPNIGDDWPAKP